MKDVAWSVYLYPGRWLALAFTAQTGSPRLHRLAHACFGNAVRRWMDNLILERHPPTAGAGGAQLVGGDSR
jgi:hypothetical protein